MENGKESAFGFANEQSMKAKEMLKQAELKKSDFINEAVYNTVVGNICKLLTKIDELDECVNFQKNCKHEDTMAYYHREGEYALKICDKCNAHLD